MTDSAGSVTRSSLKPPPSPRTSPSPSVGPSSQNRYVSCPFKNVYSCGNGVNGRGYAGGPIMHHLQAKHSFTKDNAHCRALIADDITVFSAWEGLLQQLQLWLCTRCMTLHTWKSPCKGKGVHCDTIVGPFNGSSADFLLHGIDRPAATFSPAVVEVLPASHDDKVLTVEALSAKAMYDEELSLTPNLLCAIFQRSFHTVASIPHKCRLSFSRSLKVCLDYVLSKPSDIVAWIRLILLPICTLVRYRPKADEKSCNRKRLQVAVIQRALLIWKEPGGCFKLVTKLLQLPGNHHSTKPDNEKKVDASNLSACLKKLELGHYAVAIRVLSSNDVAPCCENTFLDLQTKHPTTPPPSIPEEVLYGDPVSVDSRAVGGALRSFPRGTSCGRDGLRAQHLVDAFSGAAAAVADDLLASITGVVNLWLAGKYPGVFGELIASAPLTPLLKPGGGLRPIAAI
ncbi:hypothetical protein OROHE_018460 [Orobanche hederae]